MRAPGWTASCQICVLLRSQPHIADSHGSPEENHWSHLGIIEGPPQWPKECRRVRFPHCASDDSLLLFCGSQSTPEADLARHLRISAPARPSSSWQGPCWYYWGSLAPAGQERWGHCSQWFLADADSHVQTSESMWRWTCKGWRMLFRCCSRNETVYCWVLNSFLRGVRSFQTVVSVSQLSPNSPNSSVS